MNKLTGSLVLASIVVASGCGELRTSMLVAPNRQGHAAGQPGNLGQGGLKQVQIPGPGEMFVTMGPTDTLSSVAKAYGVELGWLIKRNDMKRSAKAGDNLIVPARATGATK
jgi:hypothetical protein